VSLKRGSALRLNISASVLRGCNPSIDTLERNAAAAPAAAADGDLGPPGALNLPEPDRFTDMEDSKGLSLLLLPPAAPPPVLLPYRAAAAAAIAAGVSRRIAAAVAAAEPCAGAGEVAAWLKPGVERLLNPASAGCCCCCCSAATAAAAASAAFCTSDDEKGDSLGYNAAGWPLLPAANVSAAAAAAAATAALLLLSSWGAW